MTDQQNGFHCELTIPAGWERLAQLRKVGRAARQAFVAMAFAPEMLEAYTQGIEPAITTAEYLPMRIYRSQHNERVDDKILLEAAQRLDLQGIVAKRKVDHYSPETVRYKVRNPLP